MKKKIIAFSMVIAMLAVIVVSDTLAYFTDTDEGVNVFTIGGIDIDLYEEVGVIDADGTTEYPERVVRFGDASAVYTNILPSNTLKKEVTVENTGKNAAYVRVAVILNDRKLIDAIDNFYEDKTVLGTAYRNASPEIEEIYDAMFPGWGVTYMKASDALATADSSAAKMGNTMRRAIYMPDASVATDSSLIAIDSVRSTVNETLKNPNNWIHPTNITRKFMNDYELMYVYYLYLEPGEEATLFNGIKIPASFGNKQMEILDNFTVEVFADAIQAEGFGGADDKAKAKATFEALELAHPFNSHERLRTKAQENLDFVNAASVVTDLEDLTAALGTGNNVVLGDNIATDNNLVISGGNFDGNGKVIDAANYGDKGWDYETAIIATSGTVSNVTVANAFRGLGTGGSGAYKMTDDVYYKNVTVTGSTYGINIGVGNGYKIFVDDSTIGDWNSYSGLSAATFNNTTFTSEGIYYASQRISAGATFTYNDCKFEQNTYDNADGSNPYYLNSYNGTGTIVLNNCYMGATKITAANAASLFDISDVTVIVDGTTVVTE